MSGRGAQREQLASADSDLQSWAVTQSWFAYMADLIASGKVRTMIDRRYQLNEASEALRYLGHLRGKVIVNI